MKYYVSVDSDVNTFDPEHSDRNKIVMTIEADEIHNFVGAIEAILNGTEKESAVYVRRIDK